MATQKIDGLFTVLAQGSIGYSLTTDSLCDLRLFLAELLSRNKSLSPPNSILDS